MILKKPLSSGCARLGMGVLVAASLAACGGSDGADPAPAPADLLAPYRAQVLQWAPCDPTILGVSEETSAPTWQKLGERLQCSTLRAPMDWSRPERSDVFISVMRLASAAPAQRQGVMLFNPGGPGADGLEQALNLWRAFGNSNPDSTQGALQLRLLDSYDMVGFSPRGTGASTRLECATNELKRLVDPDPLALTDANLAHANYNSRKVAEACLRNPLTPYINTDATARDMDLLRSVMGEQKLHYLGYSYGTWLGAWYASLFPERVGRMVLDSSQDFAQTHEQAVLAMALGRQRLHEAVMLPYAARHAEHFQLPAASPSDIQALVQALSPRMRATLGFGLGALTYGPGQADSYVDLLKAAQVLDTLLAELPDPADEDAVEQAVENQVFIAGDSEEAAKHDAAVRQQAAVLYKTYSNFYLDYQPEAIAIKNIESPVACNDTRATTDPEAWNATVRSTAAAAPLFFSIAMDNPCLYWGGPRVVQPPAAPLQGLDLLMVQSQYDAATPAEGANRFFAQLPRARRVYVEGTYQHAVFPYTDSCVDTTVVRYLLGEAPAARETICQAKPLAQDAAQAARDAQQPQSAQAPARLARSGALSPAASAAGDSAEQPTYLQPAQAQQLIDRFKQGIGRQPR